MNDEQIKEVMRLADEIADYAWKQGLSDGAYSQADHDRKSCDASRAALEAHLRTIDEDACQEARAAREAIARAEST